MAQAVGRLLGGKAPARVLSRDVSEGQMVQACLLYTSDAADERSSVDLGGRRIIKKKKAVDDSHGTDRTHRHVMPAHVA